MLLIATIGLNSFTEDKLTKIMLAGADILRYNFSYRVIEDRLEYVKTAKKIKDELNSSVKIMIDLPINKIRLGDFENRVFSVKEGDELIFKSAPYSPDCNEFVPVEITKLGEKTYVNQAITLGDGEIVLEVKEIIDQDTIKVKILNNGIVKYMKTFNIDHYIDDDIFVENYKTIIKKITPLGVNYLAISYINERLNDKIKKEINLIAPEIKKIIKIEKAIKKEELNKILDDPDYDMLLLDRGELGVNMPYEKIGIYQKYVTKMAKKKKKTVLLSTQILESTVNNFIPNRAEILALTYSILDGVDGIVFCHETAIGLRPSYTISVAKKIINEVNKYKNQI
ncbi:MAG: pyruvate kinase [Candidatus Magasanikbacteria bacterium]